MSSGNTEFTLIGWYGDPISPSEAHALLAQTESALQHAFKQAAPTFSLRLQEMIARFWLGGTEDLLLLNARRAAVSEPDKALVELIWGQLLCSQKRTAAISFLKIGFDLARHHLSATDYFKLQKRHEILMALAFAEEPSPPQSLEDLLREARVILRLKNAKYSPKDRSHNPEDTAG